MDQLTLRGFDAELERRLRELARERSLSLNKAAMLLMRRGAGLAPPADRPEGGRTVDAALDRFIGVWSVEEERQFLRSLAELDDIDPELWE